MALVVAQYQMALCLQMNPMKSWLINTFGEPMEILRSNLCSNETPFTKQVTNWMWYTGLSHGNEARRGGESIFNNI